MVCHVATTAQAESLSWELEGKSTLDTISQLESLKVLLDLQCLDGALMDPMWNAYNELSVSFDEFSGKILSFLHEVA